MFYCIHTATKLCEFWKVYKLVILGEAVKLKKKEKEKKNMHFYMQATNTEGNNDEIHFFSKCNLNVFNYR